MLEIRRVDRIDAAEHHWLDFLESGKRPGGGEACAGQRVADLDFTRGLDIGDDVARITRFEACPRLHLRGENADLLNLVRPVVAHHLHAVAGLE